MILDHIVQQLYTGTRRRIELLCSPTLLEYFAPKGQEEDYCFLTFQRYFHSLLYPSYNKHSIQRDSNLSTPDLSPTIGRIPFLSVSYSSNNPTSRCFYHSKFF